jgi:hypothetical protein
MRSLRLGELRELLEGSAFAAWWTDWQRAVSTVRDARARHEDLLSHSELMTVRSELAQRAAVDAFSRSGEADDEGTRFTAEAQEQENRALALVGEYEEQRFRTSDLWVRLGGAENVLEARRDTLARGGAAKARSQAVASARDAERNHQTLVAEYGAADRKRTRLWDDVEAAWAVSFERSLVGAEHGVVARRIRREAERLFKEAEERRTRAKQLAADAEAAERELRDAEERQHALLTAARETFGCVPGPSFLYWRHRDDKRSAFAVALAEDPDGSNVEVKALGIFTVSRQRGVAFLEPARDGLALTAEQGDQRFEEYFLGPRQGARRDPEGGASGSDPTPR